MKEKGWEVMRELVGLKMMYLCDIQEVRCRLGVVKQSKSVVHQLLGFGVGEHVCMLSRMLILI